MIVYLCGGINGLSDSDAKGWREEAKQYLKDVLDPMRRDYRGRESANVDEIVNGDLADIDACQIVLAMCVQPSWGTAMEIFYAHSKGIPVIAIVPPGPISPWLTHHVIATARSLADALSRYFPEAWGPR